MKKKCLSAKKISAKVLSAVLAASVSVGSAGAMKPAAGSSGGHDVCERVFSDSEVEIAFRNFNNAVDKHMRKTMDDIYLNLDEKWREKFDACQRLIERSNKLCDEISHDVHENKGREQKQKVALLLNEVSKMDDLQGLISKDMYETTRKAKLDEAEKHNPEFFKRLYEFYQENRPKCLFVLRMALDIRS
jgi:BMFP domain-containing protein YqiC